MDTDGFFQIVDRHAVARLKEFHFRAGGNEDAAVLAGEQADDLAMAGEVLLWEYRTGRKRPRVHHHLRFHDHAKVEGRFGPHSAGVPEPKTVMECAGLLAQIHASYWQKQTRVQTLKKLVKDGGPDVAHFEREFCAEQRLIDMDNQIRNHLIQAGDVLLADLLAEARKA